MKEKRFREDLFYRLGEFVVTIPPLRERIEDVPFLAQRFLREAVEELNRQMAEMDDETVNLLKRSPWPGNVRELKNVIRRAILFSENGSIKPEHIEFLIEDGCKEDRGKLPLSPLKELSAMAVRDVEKRAIKQVLEATNGNKTKAASILQIDYKTLLTKIKEYSITLETIP